MARNRTSIHARRERRPATARGRADRLGSRSGALLAVAGLTLASALSIACTGGSSAAPSPTRSNLLLITVDTTRADRLGCYGYERARTPAIDGLASEGVLFEHAYTSSVITLPSHSSIMTGLLPPAHAVRDNGIDRLREDIETLAERLSGAGYRTGAFVCAGVLASAFGLDQGFEQYDDALSKPAAETDRFAERNADAVTEAALTWLARSDGRPWFLWIHYFDPHFPYEPREPYLTEFADRPYDGEIAAVDGAIARLLEGRDRAGGPNGTLTILVGDHGEGHGDHGEPTHGVFVFDETARVPLLISGAGLQPEPRRVAEVVRTVDVAPTALDLLGLPPLAPANGVSLRPLLHGDETDEPLPAYTEAVTPATMFGWAPVVSLRSERWKYVHSHQPELYDMESDPGETRNVIGDHRGDAETLRASLEGLLREIAEKIPRGEKVALDADEVERLRSLGYVGGGDPSFREQLEADPLTILRGASRDSAGAGERVRRMEEMERIRERVRANAFEEAVTLATAYLEVNPENSFVRALLAEAAERLGRMDLALAQYREVLARQRLNVDAWIGAGRILTRMDDMRQAKIAYTHALAINPRNTGALAPLAGLYLIEGDVAMAQEHYRRALKERPDNVGIIFTLAKLAESRGRKDEARDYLERVIALDASHLDALLKLAFLESREGRRQRALEILGEAEARHPGRAEISVARGQIYFEQGRLDQAEGELKAAISRAPQLPQGYHGLGMIAAHRGEISQARRFFKMALDADPQFSQSRDALRELSQGTPGV